MVDPNVFVDAMTAHLGYEDVMSPALVNAWTMLVDTLNAQLTKSEASTEPWPVYTGALGIGKTQGAIMYCALLARQTRDVGVLVVVRTIAQAQEFADLVNERAGTVVAFAHYADRLRSERYSLEMLATFPVLVICHRGYERGLHAAALDVAYPKFERYHAFGSGRRSLVIVDEALDQVVDERVSRTALKQLIADLPRDVEREHTAGVRVVTGVLDLMLHADDQNRVLTDDEIERWIKLATDDADAVLQRLAGAIQESPGVTADRRRRLTADAKRAHMIEVVARLREHLHVRRWLYAAGERHMALTSSRLLMPEPATTKGYVVLDATGAHNNVYRERPDRYTILVTPQARRYDRVTLHAARTHESVGKEAAEHRGRDLARKTLSAVRAHYGDDARHRRVLIVTHLAAEADFAEVWAGTDRPTFNQMDELTWTHGTTPGLPFARLAIAHWNRLDGRNDWREYDTLVIPTLLFGDPALDLNTFQAIHHALDDDGLNDPPAAVKAMRQVRVTASVLQAMGRVRLRNLIDPAGNCFPTDIFLRVPATRVWLDADIVLNGIQDALPGITLTDWPAMIAAEDRKARWSTRERAADTWTREIAPRLIAMPDGRAERPEDIPVRTWRRITTEARRDGSPLRAALATAGRAVTVTGGRLMLLAADATPLHSTEQQILNVARAMLPGDKRTRADIGVTPDAWLRTLKKPTLRHALETAGVRVEKRGPRAGGWVLVG
jgi:hypothetical protein